MATVHLTEFTMYIIFSLFLALCAVDRTSADDLYRCPSQIPRNRFLKVHAGRCYEFINVEKNWFAARDFCSRRGGRLITIEQKHIQAFVEQSLLALRWGRNGLWIGATDDHKEHDWRWVNGGSSLGGRVSDGYQNWDRGQPSCFLPTFLCKEDCACLRLDEKFKWHDYFCRANGFEYSFICQYEMLPETTTTTSTTTTSRPTTRETTTAAPPPVMMVTKTDVVPSYSVVQAATVGVVQSNLMQRNGTTLEKSSTTTLPIDHFIQVESQRMRSEDKGMQTGSVVGMVVSFVLIFIAGIVVGVFLCRRRYRKRYIEAAAVSPGFNNVLYTAAPQKAKDTNLVAAGICVVSDSADEEDAPDHRYCDIDEIACGTSHVILPNKDSGLPLDDMPPKYCSINDNEEGVKQEQEEGGACGSSALPPPCQGVVFKQFTPEFLSKDTDVSQAYSNNLYGYSK